MIYKFKSTARVPEGVAPEAVAAELEAIGETYGRKSPDTATDAVIAHPDRYPALRAFGPKNADEAFRTAIRNGVTYAIRNLIEEPGPSGDEIRVLFLVPDDDGNQVYETIEIIAKDVDRRNDLMDQLRRDTAAFSRKQQNVLAEIQRLIQE